MRLWSAAWHGRVGISFGVGILVGSIWLGKYVTQYLPLKTYQEWLAVLVVLHGHPDLV